MLSDRGVKRVAVAAVALTAVAVLVLLASPVAVQASATPTTTSTAVAPTATPTATVPATSTIVPTATATTLPTATLSPTATPTATIPVIAYSPNSFTFTATQGGALPPHQVLNIWNSGTGVMDWSVTDTASWLFMNPVVGASTVEIDEVTLSVDTLGATPGVYVGTVAIYSTAAANSPQLVSVTFTLRAANTTVPTNTPTPSLTTNVTATPTASPTVTPPPGEGGTPTWVWPVIGALVGISAILAGIALATSGLLGKMFRKGGGEEGLPYEDLYEGEYGEPGGDTGDYTDDEV